MAVAAAHSTAQRVRFALVSNLYKPNIDSKPDHAPTFEEMKALFAKPKLSPNKASDTNHCWTPGIYKSLYADSDLCKFVTCLVIDADKCPDPDVLIRHVERRGLAFIAHTTYQHCAGNARLRLILPLASPVPVARWAEFWEVAAPAMSKGQADAVCKDTRRLYYLPVCPPDRKDQYQVWSGDGDFLDPWSFIPEVEPPRPSSNSPTPPRVTARASTENKVDFGAVLAGDIEDSDKHRAFRDASWRLRKEDWPILAARNLIELSIRAIPEHRYKEGSYERVILKYVDKDLTHVYDTVEPDPTFKDGKRIVPEGSTYHRSDLGNKERLVDTFGADFRYCHLWKRFLTWDGRRFLVDECGEASIMGRAEQIVDAMHDEARAMPKESEDDLKERKEFSKYVYGCESRAKLENFIGLAKKDIRVAIAPDHLDRDRMLLNVANGTIDLRSLTLKPHDRNDLITRLVPIEYVPLADCTAFKGFLLDIFNGDEELASWMQKAVGYSLTADTSEQVLFFLFGTGANGKGALMRILHKLLGDYAQTISSDALMMCKNVNAQGPTPEIAKLKGSRFVTASEIADGKSLDEAKIKDLTGEDVVTARVIYGESFTFTPEFKLWLHGNHKPEIKGTDYGIWRRLLPIPFTCSYKPNPVGDEKPIDKTIELRMQGELPGILAWAVEGCRRWQDETLHPLPKAVLDALNDYRSEMDIIGQFLEECCERTGEGPGVTPTELHNAHKTWADLTSNPKMSIQKLGSRMTDRGEKKTPTMGKDYYRGLKLKDGYAPDYSHVHRGSND